MSYILLNFFFNFFRNIPLPLSFRFLSYYHMLEFKPIFSTAGGFLVVYPGTAQSAG